MQKQMRCAEALGPLKHEKAFSDQCFAYAEVVFCTDV